MKVRFSVFLFFLVLFSCTSIRPGLTGRNLSVIPQPVSLREESGEFIVNSETVIDAVPQAVSAAEFLIGDFRIAAGFTMKKKSGTPVNVIRFLEADPSFAEKGEEAYLLHVTGECVEIRANGPSGFFYGYQTLKQLLPPQIYAGIRREKTVWAIPAVSIEDFPRYRWRGLMLDCARHYMDPESIKRFIDLMAVHKFNRFHWHLTDDQGWRLEIKRYPLLTQIGSSREQTLKGHFSRNPKNVHQYDGTPHKGYYTQAEAEDIVRYAAERGITVVPEIELPGHAQAAIAAYPRLGVRDIPDDVLISRKADTACFWGCENCRMGNHVRVSEIWGISPHVFRPSEETVDFLKNVLIEVMDIFPGEFIHIGGDECDKIQWKLSSDVQNFIRENHLKDENGAQSWFIREMDELITSRGRRLIGWDEILDGGLAPNAAVMSWRGKTGGIRAAQMQHDIVMTPNTYVYLDYYQEAAPYNQLGIGGYLPLKRVYAFDPAGTGISGKYRPYVLGGQANIWTEYMETIEQVEFAAYPRTAAVAEAVWSRKSEKNYPYFCRKLSRHLQRLASARVNFCIPSRGRKTASVNLTKPGNVKVALSGLEDAATVQIYVVPSPGSQPEASIPRVIFSSKAGDSVSERKDCKLFDGIAQAGIFTFYRDEPVGADPSLELSVADLTAAGSVDIYVKYIDAEGVCR